ncbi:CBS domain-containing protein [Candidatus Bathyarchaeota archaeon]|nr:CBS domain-containing protein [Candidatus Bathyarchaeota archaeon]
MRIDVKNIMVKDIITVGKDRTVASAKSLMNYFNFDALIVTNEEEPIGLVTSSDIQKRVIEKELDPHLTTIGEITSKPLIWTRYNTTLTEVAEIMEEKEVNKIPIFGNLSNGPILLGLYVHNKKEVLIEN